ncbi:MAG TPA: PEP-CTERM sorting domain-containing protein [Chthoniobacterales bacterium]
MTTEARTKKIQPSFRAKPTIAVYLVAAALTVSTSASTRYVIGPTDGGWYRSDGFHDGTRTDRFATNYLVGNIISDGVPRVNRNFFVFDLPDTNENIQSAQLELLNLAGGFRSLDPSETFTLYAVSTPIAALTAGGSDLTTIYDDLGDGVQYGSGTITSASGFLSIDLNADFIATARAATGGLIALGGALISLDGNSRTEEYAFGFSTLSNIGTTRLVLTTIPEPSAGALLGLIGIRLAMVRRKRPANLLGAPN